MNDNATIAVVAICVAILLVIDDVFRPNADRSEDAALLALDSAICFDDPDSLHSTGGAQAQ